jgi:hypothetical protein
VTFTNQSLTEMRTEKAGAARHKDSLNCSHSGYPLIAFNA